jgi:hypothetical protein
VLVGLMPISITFIALCCCSLGVVFASVHHGKAQVPDVGPGVCVQDSGTCNDPSPRYSSGSSSVLPTAVRPLVNGRQFNINRP